jgi:hypothetical protein
MPCALFFASSTATAPQNFSLGKNYSAMLKFIVRYLAGEDSVVLGRAFGLSDRRIRDIIEHERKRRGQ